MGVAAAKKFGIILEREREKVMNRKTLEKMLAVRGYALRETSDREARWMVVSTLTHFHWSFKTLSGVQKFASNEKDMRAYSDKVLALNP